MSSVMYIIVQIATNQTINQFGEMDLDYRIKPRFSKSGIQVHDPINGSSLAHRLKLANLEGENHIKSLKASTFTRN